MNRRVRVSRLIAVILAAGIATGSSPLRSQVVINEVLAHPARDWDGDGVVDFRGDEWVEVRNLGDTAVDLADYWLRDDSSRLPDIGLSGDLPPGQVEIVFGSEVVAWQHQRGWLETGFGLNNSGGDRVYLLYGPYRESLDFQILDQVWLGDHAAGSDRSIGRDPASGTWLLFDGLNPYGGTAEPAGTGCAPTPAADNACGAPVPVTGASFGQIKASYR